MYESCSIAWTTSKTQYVGLLNPNDWILEDIGFLLETIKDNDAHCLFTNAFLYDAVDSTAPVGTRYSHTGPWTIDSELRGTLVPQAPIFLHRENALKLLARLTRKYSQDMLHRHFIQILLKEASIIFGWTYWPKPFVAQVFVYTPIEIQLDKRLNKELEAIGRFRKQVGLA